MPRGVAIPEVRQQLFAAAEQVIVRHGPARLSGRAVTGAAGVATGLLYAHFADLDDFLTAYATDRAFLVSARAAALAARAGTGSVVDNVCDTLLATPRTTTLATARLLAARPELVGRVHAVLGDRTAGLDAIERAVTTYLADEQRRGRLAATARPGSLALATVGVLHHLALAAAPNPDDGAPDDADPDRGYADPDPDYAARARRAITDLVGAFTTGSAHRSGRA
ncbi:TetR/AcrR family transcriptional regulator [Micromonospora endolithica]|uniref:TetR family transcriptional regulator n=1 Tax=Micromonospora endolithica TaxID=230091 RepID=A0A3A9YTC7_9ACTN|nr:TetR/AcrR family transcriptional regulator [Micromonospora endolithica]RKN39322.1 TetR family transcriptional regulator [Micromonospora endolithica]TWJ22757.1 TetR family transcriptional regulator [Micromonospora endolithica]